VYITDATPGATIIYTLDDTNPSPTNGVTCAPSATVGCFTLLGAATIKAVAEDASGNVSAVVTQTYTAPAASNPCVAWNPRPCTRAVTSLLIKPRSRALAQRSVSTAMVAGMWTT
jgi:hypothetical protein